MPNILLIDLKTITRSKQQHPIIEIDYELLDQNLNPIGKEERILINPQIKSRTYKDGTVTHPKGEGVNKNSPNFKERYEDICSLLKEKNSIATFYSEDDLWILGEASRRYRLESENFKFTTLTRIISGYEINAYKNPLVKTYRKLVGKTRKDILPSNIKMMEEILKEAKHKYGLDLIDLPVSRTETTENYPEFFSIEVEDLEFGPYTKSDKSDA